MITSRGIGRAGLTATGALSVLRAGRVTDALDDPLAAELRGIIAEAEALQPLSRTRPDAFLEGKDGLVRRLRDFYADLRGGERLPGARLPKRSSTFRSGKIARRGGVISVERRGAR